MDIEENVQRVKEELAAAARAAGREPSEILLVAASKMNDASRVQRAIRAGVPVCGENRVQEMLEKQRQNAYEGARLHFIGHLQKNKARQVVGLAELIHSVDSVELLREIDRCAQKKQCVQNVLLEINIGREESKSGFLPEMLPNALEEAARLPAVRVRGLMAIPPVSAGADSNRPFFSQMRKLFVDNADKKYDNIRMDFLSMGMSHDFQTAIDCGANIVRIGTAIFGERRYPEKP